MTSYLPALRRTPQPTPERFLAAHPGCFIQYYDDTPARDPAKALSARSFDAAVARRKQQERCAVCFSLQMFGQARTRQNVLSYRNMGVDVDLVGAAERGTLPPEEIDRRKEEYLGAHLLPFLLQPHWVIETRHGFHVIFRVQPVRGEQAVLGAVALNRRLVSELRGDEHAALLTQVLRVPGTLQFKDPRQPFLCRLLVDNAARIPPHELEAVRGAIDAWDAHQGDGEGNAEARRPRGTAGAQRPRWLDGLRGVPVGRRNATAASVVGAILARLPVYLWEAAGWGGLKEWNRRNTAPLPEAELRCVFQSIAHREFARRAREGREAARATDAAATARPDARVEGGGADQHRGDNVKGPPRRDEPGGGDTGPVPPSPR